MATVVVVDDNHESRSFLRKLLTKHGHRVLDTSNGKDALALCLAVHPDLVITDVLMPGMDGYELVRRLRTEEHLASTRIIFFTGLFDASEAHSLAEQCGVQQVLPKPSTIQVKFCNRWTRHWPAGRRTGSPASGL